MIVYIFIGIISLFLGAFFACVYDPDINMDILGRELNTESFDINEAIKVLDTLYATKAQSTMKAVISEI